MKLAARMIPKGLQERAQPLVARWNTFLREFEWTWSKAVVGSVVLWLLAIVSMGVIPSWWLYFATNTLKWNSYWLLKLRDVIASGLFGTPFLIFIVAPLLIQKQRRKLRSESASRPTGGYR
jgi:hypothetical protein